MIRIIFLLGLVSLASCQTIPRPDRSTMAMGFAEATYGLGIEPEGVHAVISRNTLIRWEAGEPVQLSIRSEPEGTPLHQAITVQLQQLFQHAGLTLRADGGLAKQLLRVTVSDDTLLVDDEVKTRCYTQFDSIRDGYLRTVDIVATRGSLRDDRANCLLHEGMHALGFAGHPHRLHSVLSYTRGVNELTEIDLRLIRMLYSRELDDEMPLGDAVTVAYSQLTDFRDSPDKRYVPTDISLQVKENESPLVLMQPVSSGLSRQFYYHAFKNGTTSIDANYGLRRSGQTFADISYIKLGSGRIFKKQPGIEKFFESYANTLGEFKLVGEGDVMHSLGRIDYRVIESPGFSCVFVLKYINASDMDLGGHELLYGDYCSDISAPLTLADAQRFVAAIRVYDRDPVEIRKRKTAAGHDQAQRFSAIRMTGRWPLDGSPISGLKLIVQGETEGPIKISVNGEVCHGEMSSIGSNGLGRWSLQCGNTENASGRFSWDRDGTVSFQGETLQTDQPVSWIGHQVF